MRRKSLLSGLLCLALLLGLLSSCGEKQASSQYVPLSEATENTISQEHLTAAEAWPTFENLPTTHAMILKPMTFQDLFGTSLIQKDMVDMIADTEAFNAIHIGYECEFYY